ncbi:MAG: metal-dependent hydrolase [Caldisericia bacterium]
MILSTHYSFSLFILSILKKDPIIFLYSIFSLLPDIDVKFKKHRKITHTFLASLIIYLIFRNNLIFLAFFSHIFLDYLTYTPIPLLFPYKGKYSLRIIKTNGLIDKMLTLLFLLLFLINYFLLK